MQLAILTIFGGVTKRINDKAYSELMQLWKKKGKGPDSQKSHILSRFNHGESLL